jgi:hypothetical protein
MTQEQLTQLTRIFNTLLNVRTSGEDTLLMSDCVRALQQMIVEENKAAENSSINVEG